MKKLIFISAIIAMQAFAGKIQGQAPSQLVIHTDSLDALCKDSCNGQIISAVTGGTPFHNGNYHYLWSNGQTNENIIHLCPGTYTLTVTDSLGSQVIHSTTISIKTFVNASFTASPMTGHSPLSVNFTYNGTLSTTNIYFWSFGDGATNTNENPAGHVYSSAVDTTFIVCLAVTDSACKSDTCENIHVDKSASVNEETGVNILVSFYPNPVTQEIQVISNQCSVNSVEICNILGEKIYSLPITDNRSPITINCGSFASGVYFIKATTEKGVVVKKFIKE